jgi:hypothetical protein
MSVPPAPTQVRAIASDASVRLTWLDGPAAAQVTGHIITGSDGQIRSVGPDLRTQVTGLINGQAYAFTVVAVRSVGQGPPSAPTVPVTPQPPAPQNQWVQTTPMPTAGNGRRPCGWVTDGYWWSPVPALASTHRTCRSARSTTRRRPPGRPRRLPSYRLRPELLPESVAVLHPSEAASRKGEGNDCW